MKNKLKLIPDNTLMLVNGGISSKFNGPVRVGVFGSEKFVYNFLNIVLVIILRRVRLVYDAQ